MMIINRRDFLGGAFAACGGLILPTDAFADGMPNLRFGVVSDVHIGAETTEHAVDTPKRLEKALRWFDTQHVDAIMVPGDIAHAGLISQLENFASIWDRVFPGGRGTDGRVVERLFVTGNHDVAAHWVKGTPEWRTAKVFNHGANLRLVWERLFHEEWKLVWKKVIKGYAFVGSQWSTNTIKPNIEKWFSEHGDELKGSKPFFYVQHAHPKGTCGGDKISYDNGEATRALASFSNAIAFSGHSHQTLTDETSVWQGAFTSINAGCIRSGANDRWHEGYDSIFPFFSAKRKQNRMKPLDGGNGGCGLLVDVFDDHLVVQRRSFVDDMPLGPDWRIAIPAKVGGMYDPHRQKMESVGPAFSPSAKLVVERRTETPKEIAGPMLAGKPCVWLKIPHPRTIKQGSRVYDFEVILKVDGMIKQKRLVLAKGFNLPESRADCLSDCLFGVEEVPLSGKVVFEVRPRNSFGVAGRAIVASL